MCRVMSLERDGLADLALQEYVERLAADLNLEEQYRNVYILFLISIKVCAIASLLSLSDSSDMEYHVRFSIACAPPSTSCHIDLL